MHPKNILADVNPHAVIISAIHYGALIRHVYYSMTREQAIREFRREFGQTIPPVTVPTSPRDTGLV